jgi:hypothetical protein
MTTTVFNKRAGDAPPDAVYIGRGSRGVKASPFGNPWPLRDPDDDQERHDVVAKFGRWLFGDAELVAEKGPPPHLDTVRALAGKQLVCWCVPKLCHGHILAAVADGVILDRADLKRWIGERRPRP